MAHKRRHFLRSIGAIGVASTAGCVGGFGDDEESDVNVAMVYATGGLGDNSFNDMAQRGAEQAEEELGISFDEAEPSDESDFPGAQQDFADSGEYDLICCIGFAQLEDLLETADEYEDQNFMLVDAAPEEPVDNIESYVFEEEKGSFQVGHLAGLLTTREFDENGGATNPDASTVGFVGGLEVPLIQKFEAGYRAGVEHADDGADVVTNYVGDFNDTAGGQEAAISMYEDNDADIIYHAAGNTGIGVFEAAQDQERYAIGVDADQSQSAPSYSDVIVASMVKRVDTAVFEAINGVVEDDYQGGETYTLGFEDEGIVDAIGQDFEGTLPEEITAALDESRQAIIDGEIDVPTEP